MGREGRWEGGTEGGGWGDLEGRKRAVSKGNWSLEASQDNEDVNHLPLLLPRL